MRVIDSFDPSAVVSGNIQVGSADPGAKILLYNLSLISIILNFDNGNFALLHAGEANFWILDGNTPVIQWAQYDILNATTPPTSKVTGQLYGSFEEIPGRYPMALTYQTNVGNPIPVSTNVSTVKNDGNAAATQFVEATVGTETSSAVKLTNDGQLTLGTQGAAAHQGVVYLGGNTTVGAAPAKISGVGDGSIAVDIPAGTNKFILNQFGIDASNCSTINIGKNGNPGLINIGGGTNVSKVSADASGNIFFDVPSGTHQGFISANGIVHSTATTTTGGYWGVDSLGVPRQMMHLLAGDNDIHILTSQANGRLKITKSDYSADMIVISNSATTPAKMLGNNMCAASHFSGNVGSAGAAFNHAFASNTPNHFSIQCSAGPSTATGAYGAVTATQVTVYQFSTLNFSGFATLV